MRIHFFTAIFLALAVLVSPLSYADENLDKRGIRKAFIKHVNGGKLYYKKKMYEKAVTEWQKAHDLKPKDKNVETLIEKASKKLDKALSAATEKEEKRTKPTKTQGKDTLSLDGCIEIAMGNHLPLVIAKKQLDLAQFRLIEAMRKLGPTVTGKWEDSGGQVSGRYYLGTKFSVEAKQPIFYGGELVFSVRQAKVNLEIVRNDYSRIKNELILQVQKGYYSLDKAKKALKIQKGLRDRTEQLYDIAKAGYEAGVVAQVEYLKVSSQYNQANFQVVSAEEDLSMANLLLQQSMNINEEIQIDGIESPNVIELFLEDCFNLAYLNRPELRISQLSLEYFEYEKKIRQARASWPRLDLLGSYGNTREDYIHTDTDPTGGSNPRHLGPEYYYGIKASFPIFGSTLGYSYTDESWQPVVRTTQGTSSRTNQLTLSLFDKLEDISGVKEADLEYMRSRDDMNKKKQEITLEIKETFFKYKKAVILMNVSRSKIEFQSRQVEFLEVKRQLGEAQYSDVIEEMIKLAEEEFSYVQAISDYYISIATLNKAVGLDGYFKI